MVRGYTSVSIPNSLLTEIDELVSNGDLGYTSRSEFVKEALRAHVLKVKDRKRGEGGGQL
jgi:metal-responsive CopG/Arc/MetJ family transcriptional regulator